ncbi:histidine kinase [Streptomyces ficellus]|uniref:histidine kinase n=1 Tax=Streptomyces ficellus TaxID=1977088 RepID=A0ABT7Z3N0_9ACTN|nr:histidine kinase [Streptomyces ficellus]MDN3294092.1 histidine kinase [Streptomyces ficellus]
MVGLGFLRGRSFPPDRRDVLPAVGLFALGTFLYVAGWYPFFRDVHTLALWNLPIAWRLIPLFCACLAVLVRRHLPLPALGAGLLCCVVDVLMGFSISMLLVVSELLYSATLHASRRASRTLIRTVIALVVLITTGLLWSVHDWQVVVLLILLMLTIVFVPVWWAMTVRQEREVAEAERTRAKQQARIAELDRRTAVSEERARMARDLHDVIAGHLSAIAIQSDAVGSMASDGPAVSTVLRSIRKNSVEALTEMRAMIELLRGQNADEQQLPQDSPARLAELHVLLDSARATGLEVTLTPTPTTTPTTPTTPTDPPVDLPPGIPASVDLAAYRIVQEALTNAAKHAAGSRAWVAVRAEDGDLHVEVTSKLAGTRNPVLPGTGTGLLNMRERAAAIGGTVSAEPDGGCWRVHAKLPLGPEKEHKHS